MRKKPLTPYVIILILITVLTAAVACNVRYSEITAPAPVVEHRITRGGYIYEIIYSSGNNLCLRKTTKDGHVTGFYRLPVSNDPELFSVYHIAGIAGEYIYFYVYEISSGMTIYSGERIVEYDTRTGANRVAADLSGRRTQSQEAFTAGNAADGGVYIGYLDRGGTFLSVTRVDTSFCTVTAFCETAVDFPFASFAVTDGGTLYALSQDSRVYRNDGGAWTRVFRAAPGETVADMSAGDDGSLYLFLITSGRERAGYLPPGGTKFLPCDVDVSGMIMPHFADTENWVAFGARSLVQSVDGVRSEITKITVSPATVLDAEILIYTFTAFVVSAIILYGIRRFMIRRKIRLVVKLLLIIIPVFAVGVYVFTAVMTGLVTAKTESGIVDSILMLADEAAENIDGEKFEGIDWDDPYNDAYYPELRAYLDYLSRYRDPLLYGDESREGTFTSCWILRCDSGRNYIAVCDNYIIGLDLAYIRDNAGDDMRDVMLREQKPTYAYVSDAESEVKWLTVFYPVFDGGEIAGYLEISRPATAVNRAVAEMTGKIIIVSIALFAGILCVIVSVLTVSTRTLGKLTLDAASVSNGDYSVRINVRSSDETGEIAAAFNKMAESVESAVGDITAVGRGYSRFVSDRLVELLGKATIKNVNAGDYRTLTATHLFLFTDSFENPRTKADFDELSGFYETILPCVTDNGGLVTQYSARGIAAMYETPTEEALRSVLDMFAALDRNGNGAECHVFLSYSGAILGVIGSGEHLHMINVSRLIYESQTVGMAGKRFGARLIVAQSAYGAMNEAAVKYRSRFLGILHADDEMRPLYDFYDCDPPEIRLKKDHTKEQFERGVRMYYDKAYAVARSIFIDVIKSFPEDIASREYLRRSHEGNENGGEPQPVFELH